MTLREALGPWKSDSYLSNLIYVLYRLIDYVVRPEIETRYFVRKHSVPIINPMGRVKINILSRIFVLREANTMYYNNTGKMKTMTNKSIKVGAKRTVRSFRRNYLYDSGVSLRRPYNLCNRARVPKATSFVYKRVYRLRCIRLYILARSRRYRRRSVYLKSEIKDGCFNFNCRLERVHIIIHAAFRSKIRLSARVTRY